MPRPKQQHFVPRFYLEYFADQNGKVWTYDASTNRVWATSPENTARQSNIYSPKDEHGGYLDDIEDWLNSIETKAAALYPRVLNGESLTGQDRADFSSFIASLFARSPSNLRSAAEMQGYMMQMPLRMYYSDRSRFDDMMDEIDARHERNTSKEERDELFEAGQDPKKFVLNIAQRAGLLGLVMSDSIAPILFDMTWHVFEISKQHLITCDSPVAQLTDPKEYHPLYGDGGFMAKSSVVTLPLSPDRILQLTWQEQYPEGRLCIGNKRLGRLFNRQRAYVSEQYLFASCRDEGIARLGQKHKDSGRRFTTSRQDELSPVKVVRSTHRKKEPS